MYCHLFMVHSASSKAGRGTTFRQLLLSTRTVVYVPHHLCDSGIQSHNVVRRLGDGKSADCPTSPHVARVLLRPVVRRIAEQHVQLVRARIDKRLVLDMN